MSCKTVSWGSKRHYCTLCKRTHTLPAKRKIRSSRHFSLFRQWITTAQTVTCLNRYSKVPTRTLWNHINQFLAKPPLFPAVPRTREPVWITVDATHLGRWGCITVYKTKTHILYWQFSAHEDYDTYCAGISWIIQKGYIILGVTSDWHQGIVAVIKNILPSLPHQRCLVHTQRLCLSLITTRPKTLAGRELRTIVLELNRIHTIYEARIWEKWFLVWGNRYKELLRERTYHTTTEGRVWWYTHKYLRRAYRTLSSSPSNMFLYLSYEGLPKDTNGLEAEFSHIKMKLRIHRGLTRQKQVAFIYWYLYFKTREKPTKNGN